MSENSTAENEGVDLTLSGGGFRATLFHLGVVLYFVVKGEFKNVQRVFAVSGGAILAAHLLQHCDSYDDGAGKADRLGNTLRSLLDPIVRSNFRNRVFVLAALIWYPILALSVASAWLVVRSDVSWKWEIRALVALFGFVLAGAVTFRFRRHPLSIWLSERMLRGTFPFCFINSFAFRMTWDEIDNRLDVHFLATDLLTGRLADFSKDGFRLIEGSASQLDESVVANASVLGEPNPQKANERILARPISHAVAASAAFPPAFPPYHLCFDDVNCLLTDGGVFDNLGIRARDQQALGRPCIVSDAGGEFVSTAVGTTFNWTVLRNMRSTDIVMNRLAEHDCRQAAQPTPKRLSIRNTDEPSSLKRWVRDVPRIRTDLNQFSRDEAISLILHGADVASRVLGSLNKNEANDLHTAIRAGLRMDAGAALEVAPSALKNSDKVRFGTLLCQIVIPYCLLLFVALHSFGELPQLVVSLTLNNLRTPSFASMSTEEVEAAEKLFMRSAWDDEVAATVSEILKARGEAEYYRSSFLYAPLSTATLTVLSPEGAKIAHVNANRTIFAVFVQSDGLQELIIPLKADWLADGIALDVPKFRGGGRILLIAPKDSKLGRSSWRSIPHHMEHSS